MIAALAFQNTESMELGPLKEPEAFGFSFQAPGWYILGALLLLMVLYYMGSAIRKYLKNTYRREALKNLLIIESGYQQHNQVAYLKDAMILLKLVAMKAFGREMVAQLHGDQWLRFLEDRGKETPFTKYAVPISAALYQSSDVETEQIVTILNLCKGWIKTHA